MTLFIALILLYEFGYSWHWYAGVAGYYIILVALWLLSWGD